MEGVYLLWSHYTSDGETETKLVNVFRTNEEAHRYGGLTIGWERERGYGDGGNLEWSVDFRPFTSAPEGITPYHVEVYRDGALHSVSVYPYISRYVEPGDEPRTVLVRAAGKNRAHLRDYLKVQVWAHTQERAIDIAQQWRGRYIDQGRWRE